MSSDFPGGDCHPSSNSAASPPDLFRTDNLDLAAFIAASGEEVLRIEPPAANTFPPHAAIVFPLSREVEEALDVWTSGQTARISPKEFSQQRRKLYHLAKSAARGGR